MPRIRGRSRLSQFINCERGVDDEGIAQTERYKNTVTRVYETWEERGQVRVDLGDELKTSVKDVFCGVEVCRSRMLNK